MYHLYDKLQLSMTLVKLGGNNNYNASVDVSLPPEGGSGAWFDYSAAVTEEDNVIASTYAVWKITHRGRTLPDYPRKWFSATIET